MIDINNDPAARTVRVTMTGVIKLDEIQTAVAALKKATETYGGAPHLVLADMRGMKPVAPDAADAMGAGIAHVRRRGVVLCAHLTDSSTVRLQAARLARQAVEGDPGITEVVSLDEAERVLDEARARLPPLR
jgi:hypothetical protein